MERIILPAVAAMECCGRSFKGALCADLILLEFNVRLGDPEAQVLIMRFMVTCCWD
jgi:phosphoribosylamine---glycine ligase